MTGIGSPTNRTGRPDVVEFVDEGLGHTSYLVDLGNGTALVVDPTRLAVHQRGDADRRGLRLSGLTGVASAGPERCGPPR